MREFKFLLCLRAICVSLYEPYNYEFCLFFYSVFLLSFFSYFLELLRKVNSVVYKLFVFLNFAYSIFFFAM